MSRTTQLEAVTAFLYDHDTINISQANAGIPDPANPGLKIRIARPAPLMMELRNAGWTIINGRDRAGNSFYTVKHRPNEPVDPATLKLSQAREEALAIKRLGAWHCTKKGCVSDVIPDPYTQFDSRFTTGRCLTHGHLALARG